jgi:hypothetical protein
MRPIPLTRELIMAETHLSDVLNRKCALTGFIVVKDASQNLSVNLTTCVITHYVVKPQVFTDRMPH